MEKFDSMITDNEKFSKLDDEIISLRAALEKKEAEKFALVDIDTMVVAETCFDYDIKSGCLTEVTPGSYAQDEDDVGTPKDDWLDYYRNDLIADSWGGNKELIFENYLNMSRGLLGIVGMGSSAMFSKKMSGEPYPLD